jgi:hypothetical protein
MKDSSLFCVPGSRCLWQNGDALFGIGREMLLILRAFKTLKVDLGPLYS